MALPAWQQDLVISAMIFVCLVCASTSLNAHPQVRRKWRQVQYLGLWFSFAGLVFLCVDPTSEMMFLSVAYPVRSLSDPRLDICTAIRGLAVVRTSRIIMAAVWAALHHTGTVMVTTSIHRFALASPDEGVLAIPPALIVCGIMEALSFVIDALVTFRSAPKWFVHVPLVLWLLQAGCVIQLACFGGYAMSDAGGLVGLSIVAVGNIFGVCCRLSGIGISTYEYMTTISGTVTVGTGVGSLDDFQDGVSVARHMHRDWLSHHGIGKPRIPPSEPGTNGDASGKKWIAVSPSVRSDGGGLVAPQESQDLDTMDVRNAGGSAAV